MKRQRSFLASARFTGTPAEALARCPQADTLLVMVAAASSYHATNPIADGYTLRSSWSNCDLIIESRTFE